MGADARHGYNGPTVPLLLLATLLVGCDVETGAESIDVPPPDATQVLPKVALRRLTRAQYKHAIADLLGPEIVVPTALEPDVEEQGFVSIGASVSSLSPRGVEQFEVAAYDVARQALANPQVRQRIVTCAGDDEACADEILGALALKAWRRPATAAERSALTAVVADAQGALGAFEDGLTYAIATLLQTPSFLYRPEVGEDDPLRPGGRRYDAWEMASRLAFFLSNTGPDEELLDAAERDALITDEGLAEQTDRLLAAPGARRAVRSFFQELFTLHRLDHLVKDPHVFRHASPEVGPAAREALLLSVEELVFERGADFGELLTSYTTFADRRLAAIYQLPAPAQEGFGRLELPRDGPRRGLLGQVGILAQFAHPVASSATLRGKFVRKVLLCGDIPPPPADVNTALPEPKGQARTLKERVEMHLTNPACSGCHLQMDPIGLGLERFDGLGRFRIQDNGADIDPSGDVDQVPFDDAVELAEVIRDHPDFARCFVENLTRYATGEPLGVAQREEIARLTAAFEAHGRRVLPMMKTLVMSPLFRWAGEPR